jgi:hypothetical protein
MGEWMYRSTVSYRKVFGKYWPEKFRLKDTALWNMTACIHGVTCQKVALYDLVYSAALLVCDYVKDGEMGSQCSTHGRIVDTMFWWKSHKERDHWEDLGVGRWMKVKWSLEK